jgi:hypothetical protein
MSQQPPEGQSPPTRERADVAFEQWGQRIGFFAQSIYQGVQNVTTAVKNKADSMGMEPSRLWSARQASQEEASRTEEQRAQTSHTQANSAPNSSPIDGSSTMERAEAIVDRMGLRLGEWSSQASVQIQKVAARVREDAEDIWVEAQAMRKQSDRQPR